MSDSSNVDDYLFIKLLGEGGFGRVYQAENQQTHETVAIKAISKNRLQEYDGLVEELLKEELKVLSLCNSENVVKMIEYLEGEDYIYIVMEFCNGKKFKNQLSQDGDFHNYWARKGCVIPENEAIFYMKQILNGMKALHELNVIHRDLKLPNILKNDETLKIGDLGFAKRLDRKDQKLENEAMGTIGHMAPEVAEFKPYGILADMFSLGTMYYQMLFGELPFPAEEDDLYIKQIQAGPNLNFRNMQISDQSKDLLNRMLQYEPEKRLKWAELYEHVLFCEPEKENIDDLQKITELQLVSSIDLLKNKQFYQEKEEQLSKLNQQNMMSLLKKTQFNVKKVKFEKVSQVTKNLFAVMDKQFQKLQQTFNQTQQAKKEYFKKEEDIKKTIHQYLDKRNKYITLIAILRNLSNYSGQNNQQLIQFIITKKLVVEYGHFQNQINSKANIFQSQFLDEIYKHQTFQYLKQQIEIDLKIINQKFIDLLAQCKQLFLQNKFLFQIGNLGRLKIFIRIGKGSKFNFQIKL